MLTTTQRFLLGLTLFSMFFGAGNLIFPPLLGQLAGTDAWVALAGFVLTAVAFPILGVIAVARTEGLTNLANRVHPAFSGIYVILIYLSIGPCLAIPRTASTSFEMTLLPAVTGGLFGEALTSTAAQAIYSVIFFAIAFTIALNPARLTQILGKVLCPALLIMIAALFVAAALSPMAPFGTPQAPYAEGAFARGFIEGYQTMDAIAALNFGLVFLINVKALGISDTKSAIGETVRAGIIAAAIFVVVYGMLTYVGAQSGATGSNGAQTLTYVTATLFGPAGSVLIGAIFFVACLNTCVSLLSCCSEYFSERVPKLGYRGWLVLFTVSSMIVSNAGLTNILKFSVPVLVAVYPIGLLLIVLGLLDRFVKRRPAIYPISVLFTGIASVLSAVEIAGYKIDFLASLPLYKEGLFWLLPAAVGIAIGALIPARRA